MESEHEMVLDCFEMKIEQNPPANMFHYITFNESSPEKYMQNYNLRVYIVHIVHYSA